MRGYSALSVEDAAVHWARAWAVLAAATLRNTTEKGFDPLQHEAIGIALMHSELSEALEGYRHGNPPSDHIPEFSAVEEELADVVIRIMDHAAARHLRVGEAVTAKILFNRGRPAKHGGKAY